MASEKPDSTPATLAWAVRLLLLQAAGLAALGAYLLIRLFTTSGVHVGIALALVGFAWVGALAVAVVARSLNRRVAGARGPAIVVQLFVIASGGFFLQNGPVWAGAVLLVLGLVIGLLTVLPASTRALGVD